MVKFISVIKKIFLPFLLLITVTVLKLAFANNSVLLSPFLLYFLVIVISVWWKGWLTGIVISIISLGIIDYFFIDPYHSFYLSQADFINLALFLIEAVLISILGFKLNQESEKNKRGENRYKVLIENVVDVIVLRDNRENALYISPKIETVLGYTPNEYSTLTHNELIHPEDIKNFINSYKQVQKLAVKNLTFLARFKHKDGFYTWIEGSIFNFLSHPDINSIVLHFQDVSERIKLEMQKDEFISIASHELKTPLTSVKAFIQLAARNTEKNTQSSTFLNKTVEHINRLETLVSDLLDVSKINAGKLIYNISEFNFNEVLKESIESAQQNSPTHKILLEKSVDVLYKGDRLRIEQVINNLLSNAIKYSPEADRVIVRSEIIQNNIVVSIKDFGIGIEEEHLSKLFDRFYRIDNTSMKFHGLGLGLYIAAEILKRHNGSFWVESKPQEGSTFYFQLPLDEKQRLQNVQTDNQTYYKADFANIWYNSEKKWLEADWIGLQSYETIDDGGAAMLNILRENRCSKVLNNNSNLRGNWSEASDQGREVWFPAMEQAGLRYYAWIHSPSTFSQLSAQKSVNTKVGNVTIQFFSTVEEAKNWLDSVS